MVLDQIKKTERNLLAVLAGDQDNFDANYQLGMLYHRAGRDDLAIPRLQSAVNANPQVFAARFNLGIVQQAQGLLIDAQGNLETANSIKPDSVDARLALGVLLIDQNRVNDATVQFDRALKIDPGNAETTARCAWLNQLKGDQDRAVDLYRRAIELRPLYGDAHHGLALAQKHGQYSDDIKRMELAIGSPEIAEDDQILLGFALAKVFEDLGQIDRSFAYLRAANESQKTAQDFSIQRQTAFFSRHKKAINPRFMAAVSEHAVTDNTAIFVLGLPRSGTTLVEQVLASHPQVHGAGEVEHTRVIVDATQRHSGQPFPEGIEDVAPQVLHDAALRYLSRLRQNSGNSPRIVDKLPHNFLRIGVLSALMPNAKIIECARDPMDTCLSIYRHHFSPAHGYASDLTALGEYYLLYQDLMAYWRELLPGKIYQVRYETLVGDFEAQVRGLLAYCELDFDPRCLSSHHTERLIATPSANQVREPVHDKSVDRWKDFAHHLEPLRSVLAGHTG